MRHLLFSDLNTLKSYIDIPDFSKELPDYQAGNDVAFITGGTGFIGGFLLKQLLEVGTFQKVICLVRGENDQIAEMRLKNTLRNKGLAESLLNKSKLSVVAGDVLLPSFGLKKAIYNQLAIQVDHVFHFAATMNWVTPFNQDTIANIEALKRVVGFCADTRPKKLHYASSMGVWTLLNHQPGPIYEDAIHDQGDELPGGYFQSKWVNELILQKARQAGLPMNIYRIGDVKGHSENGLGDPQNFGNLVMQYFIKKGVVINSDTPAFNFIPVDYLTKAIAHMAIYESGKTYQFTNPDLVSFKDIYNAAKAVGRECHLIDYREWVDLLKEEPDHLARVLKPIFREFTPAPHLPAKSFYGIGVEMFRKRHDTANTRRALMDTAIVCPGMLKDRILEKYLIHLGELERI